MDYSIRSFASDPYKAFMRSVPIPVKTDEEFFDVEGYI
jgi:hypothetical protein